MDASHKESLILSRAEAIVNLSPFYQYEALGPGEQRKQIRLISLLPGENKDIIRCRIIYGFLAENPDYEALSYCWGDASIKRLIAIEDLENKRSKLYITENLYFALKRLRTKSGERILWVDAICINQGDDAEKNVQVAMMRDIYEKANETVIWLGEEADNSEQALSLVLHVNDAQDLDSAEDIERNLWEIEGDRRGLPKAHEQIWYDLFKVLKRPWFCRAWIVQELAVSSRVTLVCGHATLEWRSLFRAIMYLVDSGGMGLTFGITGLQQLLALDSMRNRFQERKEHEGMHILLQNRKALATDPRDHIFAFHGFFESGTLGHTITNPRYQYDCAEVYREVAIQFLHHHRNLDILSVTRVTQNPSNEKLHDLPTWAPDWSAGDLAESFLWKQICPDFLPEWQGAYRASGNSKYGLSVDGSTMKLRIDGWIIDEVNKTSAVMESSADHIVTDDVGKLAKCIIQDQKILSSFEAVGVGFGGFSKYPTGERMIEAYWKTLLGGILYGNPKAMEAAFLQWHTNLLSFRVLQLLRLDQVWFLKLYLWLGAHWAIICGIFCLHSVSSSLQVNPTTGAFPKLATHMGYRRMMKTDEGLIGLAAPLAKPGDSIVLARGGKLPLILRRKDDDWEVVGDCYIHGIMDGKLWRMLEGEVEPGGAIWDLYKTKSRQQGFWLV